MTDKKDNFETELYKPKIGFLIASGLCAVLAGTAYLFEEEIIRNSPGNSGVTFALILIVLVLAAMVLLLCYRNPKIGARLLGYHRLTGETKNLAKSDMQYSAGFKAETGVDMKRQSSRRKQARHSRKKLAQVTREMQQDVAAKSQENAETSSGSDENKA